jgi:DNA-binding PadR family transcriptional regulator
MADEHAAPLTPAVFALLLALTDGERHGYVLMSDVERLSEGAIRLGPGTLYRSLQRMRVDGLVEEVDEDASTAEPAPPHPDRRAERRRSYRLTPAGKDAAVAEAERLSQLVDAAAQRGVLPRWRIRRADEETDEGPVEER